MPVLVEADDPIVADLLQGTLDLVLEAGGWVDPTVVLLAEDGQLSVLSDAADDSPLVVVPRLAVVRVDSVTWADDDERLVVELPPDDAGDIELQMLYVQSALHNQCAKLPWLSATHPALALEVSVDLVEAVRRCVPGFRSSPLSPREVLWANRCFRLPWDASMPRVLVPLVDLLNHHAGGASGTWDGETFAVPARYPFGTAECALDYGMGRDALETAIVYGFVDDSADVARSAPIHLELDGLPDLTVVGAGRAPDGSWLPVTAQRTPDGLVVSHLTFSAADPHRAARELASATGLGSGEIERALGAVIEENLRLLDDVQASARGGSPAESTLAGAAGHQAAVMRRSAP